MARFLHRKRVAEAPSGDGVWHVPPRFNFTRDVVEAFAADPLRPALTFVDRDGIIDRRTYAEVAAEANRWAALLRGRGLAPGDRLLVLVGKTPTWHAILLGALKAGLVAVPCSEMLRAHDLAFRAGHSGARLVVADRDRAPELSQMDVSVEVVLVEEAAAELRQLSPVQPTHDTAADDIAFILYTSGTTKEPRGAAHTHGYTWAQRLQAEHWLDARSFDRVWCTAGTGSAKSIWNVLLGPWSRGAEIVIHEGGFDAEQRFDLIQRLGVTVLCQAPTEYRLMAKLPSLARFDLRRVRHAVSAGEPLDPEVIEAFRDTFGLTVYEGYGQTESTLLVANAKGAQIKPGSIGLPTPGHEVAVIDDEGNEQPVDTEGDIAVRGRPPSLFLGYWNAPDETSAVFRGEWYLTGDRATRDEDGYLWFTGRADDVILSAAYRFGPFEVESALLEHPAVAESAVVGKPDADGGDLVKAFVVLHAGVEPSDELAVELQDHVKAVTAPYKVPSEIEFVAGLPKTTTGKIRRVELRENERSKVGRAAGGTSHALDEPAEQVTQARARDAEALAAEILALTEARQARADDDARAEEEGRSAEAARAQEAEARSEAAKREAAKRAAETAERAAATAAIRAERRADLERRTAEALAEEQARFEEEARAAEQAAEQARLAEEQARFEEEARAAGEAAETRLAAEQARAADELSRRETEVREAEAMELGAPQAAASPDPDQYAGASTAAATKPSAQVARKAEDQRRKDDERQRKEEEKVAAEQRQREEAEERSASAERGREAERRRKEDEKRRRDEEKAAAERDRAEADARRRAAQRAADAQRAEEARQRAADEERRKEQERQRKEDEKRLREADRKRSRQSPTETVPDAGDEALDEYRPNAELIARLRAYGHRERDDTPPESEPDSE